MSDDEAEEVRLDQELVEWIQEHLGIQLTEAQLEFARQFYNSEGEAPRVRILSVRPRSSYYERLILEAALAAEAGVPRHHWFWDGPPPREMGDRGPLR